MRAPLPNWYCRSCPQTFDLFADVLAHNKAMGHYHTHRKDMAHEVHVPDVSTTAPCRQCDGSGDLIQAGNIIYCDECEGTGRVPPQHKPVPPPTSEQITEAIVSAEDRLNATLPELRTLFGL